MPLISPTSISAAVNAINTAAIAGFGSLHTATTLGTGASEYAGVTRQAEAWTTSSAGSNSSNTALITWSTSGATPVTHHGTWSLVSGGVFNIGAALGSSVTAASITAAIGALTIGAS